MNLCLVAYVFGGAAMSSWDDRFTVQGNRRTLYPLAQWSVGGAKAGLAVLCARYRLAYPIQVSLFPAALNGNDDRPLSRGRRRRCGGAGSGRAGGS